MRHGILHSRDAGGGWESRLCKTTTRKTLWWCYNQITTMLKYHKLLIFSTMYTTAMSNRWEDCACDKFLLPPPPSPHWALLWGHLRSSSFLASCYSGIRPFLKKDTFRFTYQTPKTKKKKKKKKKKCELKLQSKPNYLKHEQMRKGWYQSSCQKQQRETSHRSSPQWSKASTAHNILENGEIISGWRMINTVGISKGRRLINHSP